jgi:hypothetical protein
VNIDADVASEPAETTLRKIADAIGLDPGKELDTVQLAGQVDCEVDFLMSEVVLDNELNVSDIAVAAPQYASSVQWAMFEGAVNDGAPVQMSPSWWREIKLRLTAELAEDDTLKGLIAAAVLYNRIKMGIFDTEMGYVDGPDEKQDQIGNLKETLRSVVDTIDAEFS